MSEQIRHVTIVNRKGLHARPASKVVKCAEQFDAQVMVKSVQTVATSSQSDEENDTVSASSILGLMMLGASQGTQLALQASGPQAKEALDALEQLITNRFGEEA